MQGRSYKKRSAMIGACMAFVLPFLLGIGAGSVFVSVNTPPAAFAAVRTISANGEYVVSSMEESLQSAKLHARLEALHSASEQAGVYIDSYTETKGGMLAKDEVQTLSSAVLSVTQETYTTDDMNGQGLRVVCHIEASVDTEKVDELLKIRREDAEKWRIVRAQNKALNMQVTKLAQENAGLKDDYAKAKTALEQQKIKEQMEKNRQAAKVADLVQRGNAAFAMQKYGEALELYQKAINLDPNCVEAHIGTGHIWDFSRLGASAIRSFTEALRIDPSNIYAYDGRGHAYEHIGKLQKAIDDFSEEIRINPSSADAYVNRGAAYSSLQQYQKSIDDYTQAIRIDPSCDFAYANRGNLYEAFHEHQKAIEDCTKALRLNPSLVSAYCTRAYAYFNLQKFDASYRDAMQAKQFLHLSPSVSPLDRDAMHTLQLSKQALMYILDRLKEVGY